MKSQRNAPYFGAQTKYLSMTALLSALCCVATLVLVIPSPTGGYMNLGDTIVLLGAYLLGPVYGAAAAGFGAALADLVAGYAVYAPATFVIKDTMALLAGGLYSLLGRKNAALPVCGAAAEFIMVAGYWLYDGLLLGSLAGSAVGIPSNVVQGVFGVAASTLLALALKKIPYVREQFPRL